MRRHFAALIALLGVIGPARGQQGQPRPGAETVKVSLALIDVLVRDRNAHPVTGLTREDFELVVDGQPVDPASIESFDQVCEPYEARSTAAQGGQVQTVPADDPLSKRHMVIYLDFSQLSLAGRQQSLRAIRAHLAKGLGPSDRVMILAFKKELRLVQDFTSDAALLVSHVDQLLDDTSTLDTDVLEENSKVTEVADQQASRRGAAVAYAVEEESRSRRSIQAIESALPLLEAIRGRKALVLFTDALRDEPGVQYLSLVRSTPKAEGVDISQDLLRLMREANTAGVSLYTVHASGLEDHPVLQLARTGPMADAARAGTASALSLQAALAAETGGRALQRENDLAGILKSARQDLSCYYLIGYPFRGVGDNRSHGIVVRLRPDRAGRPPGLTLRHRASFTDQSPRDRSLRVLQSALEAPALYRAFPLETEAYALAPSGTKRGVLVKVTLSLDSLALIPAGATRPQRLDRRVPGSRYEEVGREGRAMVSGLVTRDGTTSCSFRNELVLKLTHETRLSYQTGCALEPGKHTLTVAVLDQEGAQVAARRTELVLEPVRADLAPYLGEVHLWAQDRDTLLVTAGAEQIGFKDTAGEIGLTPRAERRLTGRQMGALSFMVCPQPGARVSSAAPIRLNARIEDSRSRQVGNRFDFAITEPGCRYLHTNIAAGSLRTGIYSLFIQVEGPASAQISRRAAFAVD